MRDEGSGIPEGYCHLFLSKEHSRNPLYWNRLDEVRTNKNGDIGSASEEHRIRTAVRKAVGAGLACAAVLLYPEAHPAGWHQFARAFAKVGGVIEASPSIVLGSPTVNIFVEPSGAVRVLACHEQIFCPAYRAVASAFPQCSAPAQALIESAAAVGGACAEAGVMGHVTVDFVVVGDGGQSRLWAVDLNLSPAPSFAAFQIFDFLAGGGLSPDHGAYVLPPAPPADLLEPGEPNGGTDGDPGYPGYRCRGDSSSGGSASRTAYWRPQPLEIPGATPRTPSAGVRIEPIHPAYSNATTERDQTSATPRETSRTLLDEGRIVGHQGQSPGEFPSPRTGGPALEAPGNDDPGDQLGQKGKRIRAVRCGSGASWPYLQSGTLGCDCCERLSSFTSAAWPASAWTSPRCRERHSI
eukprot:jgi/Botrbrau1/13143/Bobra.0187s0093.2